MSRASEYSPSSDDDLPCLKDLIPLGNTSPSRNKKSMTIAVHNQDRPKKSAPKSSTRKVRRLGDASTLTAMNPLLLPWNHDGDDSVSGSNTASTEKSPKKTGASQERPPITGETATSIDAKSRRVARRKNAVTPINEEQETKQHNETKAEPLRFGKAKLEQPVAKVTLDVEVTKPSQAQEDITAALSDADDLSSYQTAAENTSDFSDSFGSDFATNESNFHRKQHEPRPRNRSPPHRGSGGKKGAPGRVEHPTPLDKPTDLSSLLDKLRIDFEDTPTKDHAPPKPKEFGDPKTPRPGSKGLVSPLKLTRIPKTSSRPSTDAFWCQEFIDDWNDQHSPRKQRSNPISPRKKKAIDASPSKTKRKSFDAKKRSLAEEFLRELDSEITSGKISELTESTRGVKLVWTKTLNTTAGRANWRRETIRTREDSGTTVVTTHAHHASIELAEKVINDEDKLLNVLAHEFCHLANFMISGITKNPHGKEFKAWADKCSRAFGSSHGIKVTTKHTYDIDFKYVWACNDCGSEYKRHSKSIDPKRHRCGSCRGILAQTKPSPRERAGAAGGEPGKRSDYQVFVREQMKTVRGENPGSPQKEVMKIVAARWVEAKKSFAVTEASRSMTVDVDVVKVD
ncbi:sprt family metallopeptidase [Ophiocordyceps camponoti-floridani]|uniref:Sprt family metallopeptidase n=1 Tax=Ophiocordyceps camponoti-floridani TaxID=2030778 RepID=A0A8H4Q969_9HYPO|nr:sprt family metallopeptidase [Ophiocordyceps camponoti-floridani]